MLDHDFDALFHLETFLMMYNKPKKVHRLQFYNSKPSNKLNTWRTLVNLLTRTLAGSNS